MDIDTKGVLHEPSLQPPVLAYEQVKSRRIVNNGHSFNVEFDDSQDKAGQCLKGTGAFSPGGEHWGAGQESPSQQGRTTQGTFVGPWLGGAG